jgi:glutamyl/glutaminyl-tRNA synthetase
MPLIQTFSKTRIAPTPSGFLHMGNVLSFALTAALARQFNARILLRIDDLDQQRVDRKYVQDIFDTLHYLEIPWEEGPRDYEEYRREYSQLHRLGLYQQALETLRASGRLLPCTC